MKKVLLLIAVTAACTFTAKAQSGGAIDSTQLNVPIITFESETIDFGTIEYDANGDREFKFKNTGREPLVIKDVIKTCGCTTPAPWPKDPILPGQSGSIKFHYDTKRVGNFDKTITIVSNASEPNKVLHFKGNVLPQKQEEQFPGGKK
jgi:hypothetical protein